MLFNMLTTSAAWLTWSNGAEIALADAFTDARYCA